jgi:5-methylcytosine-specific restriction enzyme subunit McrC
VTLAHLQVREHDTLVRGDVSRAGERNVHTLAPAAFEALQTFLSGRDGQGESLNAVATFTRLGRAEAVKLSQWVGLIRLPDSTVIEILPKTHERPGARQSPDSLPRSRALLLRMLTATDERFRVAPPAELDTAHMPLLEVVLRYALEGIRAGVRRGVPHAYVSVQEERPGLRGRLDLPRQVRQPAHRAHLLHVTFDEFLPDRPETRLVRLAVERAGLLTAVPATKRLARELLYALDAVPASRDVRSDFSAWRLERGHTHFEPLRPLCEMLLRDLNPLVGGQQATAHALLFDMNRVYEAYVAQRLQAQYPDWIIETQVTDRALGHVGTQRAFNLRPDLLITLPSGQIIVADTKWKRLNPASAPTFDIQNGDAYQMLAYSEVFQASQMVKTLYLLYPHLPELPARIHPIQLAGKSILHIATLRLDEKVDEPWLIES